LRIIYLEGLTGSRERLICDLLISVDEVIEEFIEALDKSIVITVFVFSMMIIVDWINILTKGKIKNRLLGKGIKQYVISSFLGSTPGCLGAFMSVSMYVHGMISFGALTGCMIATSGDEAFVMIALFPETALLLFLILFLLGIVLGFLTDRVIRFLRIRVCEECRLQEYHEEKLEKVMSGKPVFSPSRLIMLLVFLSLITLNGLGLLGPREMGAERILFISLSTFLAIMSIFSTDHYLEEHITEHILKKHLWKVFLWTLGALVFVSIAITTLDLENVIKSNLNIVLVLSALVGIIPESGPHMVFTVMYHQGLIPFSILLTSSVVQDGHGMLPLFSHTIRDSILIKIINVIVGLAVGFILYFLGL